MKKQYETPMVEVIEFNYRDQVIAASGVLPEKCTTYSTSEVLAGSMAECTDIKSRTA